MLGIKNEKYIGLNNFMELFYEQWKTYAEQWEIAEKNIRNMVQNFSGKMKPVRVFCILGEQQFTYQKPLCFSEVERMVNARDVNEYLMEKIVDKSFGNYDMLCDEMIQSELLSNTNKAILNQCVQAMNIGLYDLTLVGIVAVLDGVLFVVTKDDSAKTQDDLNKLKIS